MAPSLPGYGLSFSPGQPRFGVEEIADCFASLMSDVLGYKRFGAQGGDWGSFITSRLAHSYPDRLVGIHLNMMPLRRDPKMIADPTSEEQRYLEQLVTWLKDGTGYQWIRDSTRRSHSRIDSPVGLAAWIAEKFRAWSDCGGDFESVFTEGRASGKHQSLLVHQCDWLFILALLCSYAPAMAGSR